MKKIPLTLGQFALVDDEDYERLNAFKWSAMNPQGSSYYAVRNRSIAEAEKLGPSASHRVYMHRDVINAPSYAKVRAVNGNSLDCQRANIKVKKPSPAAVIRRERLGLILPCFPIGDPAVTAKHPYRGLYKDKANNSAGGILVKSFKSATGYFGPYRTVAQAVAKRDAEEAERRNLGMPLMVYEYTKMQKRNVVTPCDPLAGASPAVDLGDLVGPTGGLLDELL